MGQVSVWSHDSELGVLCSHLSFSSTVAYVFSIVLYVTVTIPSLRTIVTPLQEETKEIQVQALSVLCAGNVIIIVCLLAVLALQVWTHFFLRPFLFTFCYLFGFPVVVAPFLTIVSRLGRSTHIDKMPMNLPGWRRVQKPVSRRINNITPSDRAPLLLVVSTVVKSLGYIVTIYWSCLICPNITRQMSCRSTWHERLPKKADLQWSG